ncbi:MAG TPA: hypothetical protein VFV38_18910 [Ktedonobacteraceae bacterium]|nr:hypothetical protein [Ktedonobacteraceae bacterium]
MSYQELLREKAAQVCERCKEVGIPQPFYRLASEYSVNFSWRHEGKTHPLALYYNAKQQSWKPVAQTEWLQQIILPALQPLFERSLQMEKVPLIVATQEQRLQAHFADALACFELLVPFAQDNIDFSILCQRVREAVRGILSDPILIPFHRSSLVATLEEPDVPDFSQAKEYLAK